MAVNPEKIAVPYYQCPDREQFCHDRCEKYQHWKNSRQTQQTIVQAEARALNDRKVMMIIKEKKRRRRGGWHATKY